MTEPRYEVVETQGWDNPDVRNDPSYTTEVSVIDTCNCGRVVATFYAHGTQKPSDSNPPFSHNSLNRRMEEARTKAQDYASRLNAEERLWEAIGA